MSPHSTVLVVDDDKDVLHAAELVLSSETMRVKVLESPGEVEAAIERTMFDALLVDMNFAVGKRDGGQGLGLLALCRRSDPTLSVVLMTAYAGVALAVEALKGGAVDFVMKPWRNETLLEAVRSASALTRQRRQEEQITLDALERQTIERTLERHRGNISLSAAALGISRAALYRRMAKHAL
ncbi:MAG TPA: response regulator [Steroidobacteraceae bacterium]